MKRWKILIVALLTAVTSMVGPVGLVTPAASSDACGSSSPHAPVCIILFGSTPDCMDCFAGNCPVMGLLDKQLLQSYTAYWEFQDGTAQFGIDYGGMRRGQFTIPPGETEATFAAEVYPVAPGSAGKVFYAVLTRVSAGTIGNGRVEIHIRDGR